MRDLLTLLRCLDDSTDQIALVATLRSVGFACADDDLYRWQQAGGRWNYWSQRPETIAEDDPVAQAMQWLQETSQRRWQWSVSELLLHTVRARRLMELAVGGRAPREQWQRYRLMIDQARAFADRGGATLSEFLEWANQQAEQDVQVIESVVPEQDHDAVRIMTVHAAKGLEFPIVVCAGLAAQVRADTKPLLWQEHPQENEPSVFTPEVRLAESLQTPGYEQLQEQEKQLEAAERVRLTYVAMTRARDYLVVSLHRRHSKDEENTLPSEDGVAEQDESDSGQKIQRALQEMLETPKSAAVLIKLALELAKAKGSPPEYELFEAPEDDGDADGIRDTTSASQAQADDTPEARQRWIDDRAKAVARLSALPLASATGVAKPGGGEAPNHEPPGDVPSWRRGRAGTAIGRATHAVLQVIDLEGASDDAIRAAAQAQAAAESLTDQAAGEIERLVHVALKSESVRAAVTAKRHWRELYVAAEVEGVLLDGFIDLLYELPNGDLAVVDYKTDALKGHRAFEAAVSRYRLQAAAYALMLEASQGKKVGRCTLLFLEPDQERQVHTLGIAMAEVRDQLKAQQQSAAKVSSPSGDLRAMT